MSLQRAALVREHPAAQGQGRVLGDDAAGVAQRVGAATGGADFGPAHDVGADAGSSVGSVTATSRLRSARRSYRGAVMATTTKVPPVTAARIVERVRHHLYRLNQRLLPAPGGDDGDDRRDLAVAGDHGRRRLGVADALAAGPLTIDELAARVGADPDALRRLLRALIGRGVFRRRRDGRYELNSLAERCVRMPTVSMRRRPGSTDRVSSANAGPCWPIDPYRTICRAGVARQGGLRLFRRGSPPRGTLQPDHVQHFAVDRRFRGRRLRLQRLFNDCRRRRRARPTAGHHPGGDAGLAGRPVRPAGRRVARSKHLCYTGCG